MVQKAFHGFPLPFQLPEDGTTGQFLRKKAGGALETEWISAAAGTGDMLASAYDADSIGMDVFGGGLRLPTRSAIAAISIAAGVDYIQTAGYSTVGDGGAALYKRVVSEPSHPGKVQSADGAWWELVNETVTPAMFGAAGDGSADDTAAITDAITIGRALNWGGADKIYRITANITVIPPRDVFWAAFGATILLDSPASIQSAIMLNCGGRNVTIIGALTLDCQQKAFIGFFFQNSSTTTYGDFFASNLKVRNVYRASTAFTGGDGIWVRGGWRNVYFERPDIRGVLMAAGAGIAGTQGVTGITVSAMTLAPQEVTIVAPYIDRIHSEDVAYTADQDGIRVFGPEDDGTSILTSSHFSLMGGKIMNCGGRGVKSQMEFGHVIGTHFIREGTAHAALARSGSMPEIDFQVGGGIIENIECKYVGSAPDRIVQLTGSRQQTPVRYGASAKVDGVRVSRTGANAIRTLVQISPEYMRAGIIDIKNVSHVDSALLSGHAINVGDQPNNTAALIINLENIIARVDPASFVFARCTRTVGTTHFVGRNIYATQAATDFVLASAGAVTETLEGKNINVA